MVFSNLQHHEKDAFFALLDEYFSSRPQVLTSIGTQSATSLNANTPAAAAGAAAGSAFHRALVSNPEGTARLVSAGLRHAASGSPSHPSSTAASDGEGSGLSVAGRVAALRNTGAFTGARPGPPPIAEKPSGQSGLVSARKWGAVDTSSTGNALSSIYGSIAKKSPTPPDSSPPVPAAFPPKKNTFAPPPVRRGVSDSQSTHAPPPPPPPPVAQEEPEEEEAHGEWAEALYDYESEEPGDLNIREKQRVLVTERTSDDWWTGEFNGRTGLFPASYVKIL